MKTAIIRLYAGGLGRKLVEIARFRQVLWNLAGTTGLEPATSCVTGMRSNQTELRPHLKQWLVASD